jgi:hypothetical protein
MASTAGLRPNRTLRWAREAALPHVSYRPEVKIIPKAAVEASIQGASNDGHGVVFKDAAPQIHALKAGDTFLVKNAFAAKAMAAETRGDQTVIMTNQAKLAELVRARRDQPGFTDRLSLARKYVLYRTPLIPRSASQT